jgi:hypothetical protein
MPRYNVQDDKVAVALDQLKSLKPLYDWMQNADTIQVLEGIERELEQLKELVWALNTDPNSTQGKLLQTLGMPEPKSLDDIRTVMYAVRSTVFYMTRKLRYWKTQVALYEQLEKGLKDGRTR